MAIIEGGNVIEGADHEMHMLRGQISSAQLLALNATPQTIIPAPGVGKAAIFQGMMLQKPAGVAYGGIAAGEDLSVKYTDAAGLELAQCETTGFLDQATNQIRYVRPQTAASGNSSFTPVENAALVLHLLSGEITTGDQPLNYEVRYYLADVTPQA